MPGHVELVNVLWERAFCPMSGYCQTCPSGMRAGADPEAAVGAGSRVSRRTVGTLAGEGAGGRVRQVLETHFDELFSQSAGGSVPGWIDPCREVLITWEPRR